MSENALALHYMYFWGGAGGLEVQATIQDQKKWDGKGSPPEAVEKVAPPTINTARLTDLQTD